MLILMSSPSANVGRTRHRRRHQSPSINSALCIVVILLCLDIKTAEGGFCWTEALMSCDCALVMMINVFCILSVQQ